MSVKECQVCGRKTEAVGGTRYCPECAEAVKISRQRSRKAFLIPGQSEKLSRDVHAAIEEGVSYGRYIGKRYSKELRRRENRW
ncbi:MAG: hypothetical protein J6Y71_04490 [Ruminococcus sp.]|nr:hypothetical protein [Ruminococcus sp.]